MGWAEESDTGAYGYKREYLAKVCTMSAQRLYSTLRQRTPRHLLVPTVEKRFRNRGGGHYIATSVFVRDAIWCVLANYFIMHGSLHLGLQHAHNTKSEIQILYQKCRGGPWQMSFLKNLGISRDIATASRLQQGSAWCHRNLTNEYQQFHEVQVCLSFNLYFHYSDTT